MDEGLGPSASRGRILVRQADTLKMGGELLCKRAGNHPSQEIPHPQTPSATVGLAHGNETPDRQLHGTHGPAHIGNVVQCFGLCSLPGQC